MSDVRLEEDHISGHIDVSLAVIQVRLSRLYQGQGDMVWFGIRYNIYFKLRASVYYGWPKCLWDWLCGQVRTVLHVGDPENYWLLHNAPCKKHIIRFVAQFDDYRNITGFLVTTLGYSDCPSLRPSTSRMFESVALHLALYSSSLHHVLDYYLPCFRLFWWNALYGILYLLKHRRHSLHNMPLCVCVCCRKVVVQYREWLRSLTQLPCGVCIDIYDEECKWVYLMILVGETHAVSSAQYVLVRVYQYGYLCSLSRLGYTNSSSRNVRDLLQDLLLLLWPL